MGIGERIRINGVNQLVEFDEAITNYEASLSNQETAQFTLTIADTGDTLLRSRYLQIGYSFDLLRHDGKVLLPLEVAAEESSEAKGGSVLTVTARARGIQRLKWIKGPLILNNLTDTAFVKKMCARVGLAVVAQETGGEPHAVGIDKKAGQPAENAWEAIKRLAEKNGYLVFEARNTLYFGKPTWMLTALPGRVLNVAVDDTKREPGILGRPKVRRSADDKGRPVTVTVECTDTLAEQYRPGMVMILRGMPVFDGNYLISESRWSKGGTGTITAMTPIDPEVSRPATEAERMGTDGAASSPPGAGAATGATGEITMDDFLYGLRMHESNGNYQAQSPISTASGAYQYINGTWNNYRGYARAKDAPPSVQDERARADCTASHKRYGGDWEKVAAYHFYPKWANDKSKWNQSPSKGNPTVRTYVDSVIGKAKAKAGVRPPTGGGGSGEWVWPTTSKRTTSEFGMRKHPITGEMKLHAGLDIGVPTGTSVFAARPGKVIRAGTASGYGIAVYIDHGGGLITRYGHLSRVSVNVGQQVRLGEKIAVSGATGGVTGPHLHFEVRPNNVPKNPRDFLPK